MLRKSSLWACGTVGRRERRRSAGRVFGQRLFQPPVYGMVPVLYAGAYYGGMFVPSGPFGHLHEYKAFDPSCAFLRRVVFTPSGPQSQLVPVCF